MNKEKNTNEKIGKTKDEHRKDNTAVIMIAIDFMLVVLYLFLNFLPKIGYGVVSTFTSIPQKTIKVTQDNIEWDILSNLDIFCNPEFDSKKIIAPMSKSDYTFQITNTLNIPITYDIIFKELNEYNINMKYKLKLDNVYIAGGEDNYVDVQKMDTTNIIVAPKSTNSFTIEWCWINNYNDTEIGKKVYADYKLYIDVLPDDM